MTLRDYENRLRVLFQQLQLYNLYPEDFIYALGGQRNVDAWIDSVLDEINRIQLTIKKLRENEKK